MFFILSKTAGLLISPLVLLLVLLVAGLLIKKALPKGILLGLFFFLAFVFTNPFITNEVLLQWETPPTPYQQLQGRYDVAIILSGVTASNKRPYDRIHLHKGADRILHAVQLYRQGKVDQLLLSGGAGSLRGDSVSEAYRMKQVLLLAGIPENAILLESKSRNTHENALLSKGVLATHFPDTDKRLLLITSAFHMPRAEACFAKQGLSPTPFSTDFYSIDPQTYAPEHFLVPDPEALQAWSRLFKEWMGYASYAMAGYL